MLSVLPDGYMQQTGFGFNCTDGFMQHIQIIQNSKGPDGGMSAHRDFFGWSEILQLSRCLKRFLQYPLDTMEPQSAYTTLKCVLTGTAAAAYNTDVTGIISDL